MIDFRIKSFSSDDIGYWFYSNIKIISNSLIPYLSFPNNNTPRFSPSCGTGGIETKGFGYYCYGVFKLFYYANQKRDWIDSRVVLMGWLRDYCWLRDYYLRVLLVEGLLLEERLLFDRLLLRYFYMLLISENTFSERRPQKFF